MVILPSIHLLYTRYVLAREKIRTNQVPRSGTKYVPVCVDTGTYEYVADVLTRPRTRTSTWSYFVFYLFFIGVFHRKHFFGFSTGCVNCCTLYVDCTYGITVTVLVVDCCSVEVES